MRLLVCIGLVLLMSDCATSDFKPSPEAQCRISRYVYTQESGSDVSYEISYTENSFTQVSLMTQEKLLSGNWVSNMVYKHNYKNDSLYIVDFRQFKEGDTYISAQIGDRISVVVTTFPENMGTYRYSFDYSKSEEITVTLEKMEGATAVFDSRGVYKFTNSDVDTLLITRNPDLHGDDADPYTSRMKLFTYDIVRNPLEQLILPHFMKPELPDVTFFSSRNRTIEKYDDVTLNYTFQYGTDPMPVKMTKPSGIVEKYEYNNCTN